MKQYNNYADLITFTRASSGTALRPISYGDELVTNGTFDTDVSGWSVQSNATAVVTNGEVQITGDGGYNDAIQQQVSVEVGKVYRVQAVGRKITSDMRIQVREASNPYGTLSAKTFTSTSNETFIGAFVATQTVINIQLVQYAGGAGSGAFDNISVREVLFDQPNGTLTLFNHPTNIPRIEYDSDGNRLGLLVEESRSNLLTYSEDFTQWTSLDVSLTVDATQSPDGNENATLLASTGSSAFPRINESLSISSPTTLTFSIYVKENTGDNIFIRFAGTNFAGVGGTISVTSFEFATESFATTSGTSATSTYQKLNNGWYRIAITLSGDTFTDIRVSPAFAETNTDSTYIYGAQLEAGSFPTSYIPSNSGSTTTRSADVASIGVSEFGFNQSEGTLFVEASGFLSSYSSPYSLNDGTSNNRVQPYKNNSDTSFGFDVTTGLSSQANIVQTVSSLNSGISHAACYKDNDFSSACNGILGTPDTSGSITTYTQLEIGKPSVTANYLNGHLKSIKYYPRRLTNSQLVEITS